MIKAIMYHYVQKPDRHYPGLKFLHEKSFIRQLDFLEKKFGFIKRQDWLDSLDSKSQNKNLRGVILTFDDGLACHYDTVYQILRKKNLWGIFYIPCKPYLNNEVLDVHKIHILISKFEIEKLLKFAEDIIDESMILTSKIEEFKSNTYQKQNNQKSITDFKRLLNYFIKEKHKSNIINEIAISLGMKNFSKQYYLNIKSIQEMHKNNMIIGSHSVNHPLMSKLNFNEQKKEIDSSIDFLKTIINYDHKTYCHPYGGRISYNEDTFKVLNEKGVRYAFSVENRDITYKDLHLNFYALPRYDCTEFPFGTAYI